MEHHDVRSEEQQRRQRVGERHLTFVREQAERNSARLRRQRALCNHDARSPVEERGLVDRRLQLVSWLANQLAWLANQLASSLAPSWQAPKSYS